MFNLKKSKTKTRRKLKTATVSERDDNFDNGKLFSEYEISVTNGVEAHVAFNTVSFIEKWCQNETV